MSCCLECHQILVKIPNSTPSFLNTFYTFHFYNLISMCWPFDVTTIRTSNDMDTILKGLPPLHNPLSEKSCPTIN